MDGLEATQGMMGLRFSLPEGRPPRLLFIGAHSDDIEIGCGGTVIELLDKWPEAQVDWVVLSGGPAREREARAAASRLLPASSRHRLRIADFRGSYFPSEVAAIKDHFERLKREVDPDMIFTHAREELHQDHRVTGELTWNTWRNHLILEYEIPKFDGGLGSPSVFMPLSTATVEKKVGMLMEAFPSQHGKPWFTRSTFEALMRLRGVECNASSGFAEAFYCRKLLLGPQ